MKKRMSLVSILLTICLVISLMQMNAVYAADGISYINADGDIQYTSATEITETYLTENSYTLNSGWYVVNSDVYIAERITVNGEVHLILSDGHVFRASKGITVHSAYSGTTNALTIYAQSRDSDTMGILEVTGIDGAAGIGGTFKRAAGTITINGGIIKATGGSCGAGIGGGQEADGAIITINGGIVEAAGGDHGAGIGTGFYSSGGTITVNGGFVCAFSVRNNSTGIGDGFWSNGTTFSVGGDAVVIASSISDLSYQTNPDTQGIVFNGTEGVLYGVNVIPDVDFSIPEGHTLTIDQAQTLTINSDIKLVNSGIIQINGTLENNGIVGNVINKGSITGNEITGSEPVNSCDVNTALTNLYFVGSEYAVSCEDYKARIFLTVSEEDYTLPKSIRVKIGDTYIAEGEDTYTYNSNTGELTIKNVALTGSITVTASALATGIAADFAVVATNSGETLEYGVDYIYPAGDPSVLTILSEKAITISNADPNAVTADRIYVADGVNAHVTLAGVNINTSKGGSPFVIEDNSKGDVTVTLAEGTENVLASGTTDCAGLLKNGDTSSGTLTINGNGKLTASGSWNSAGIGSNSPYDTANIVIESGMIIANGSAGAGIGSGWKSNAYNIVINGGTVTANGGIRANYYPPDYYGDGIGAGHAGTVSNIVITGGSVYATVQGGGAAPIGEPPTDGKGNFVYLYEIENPQKADITINGNDYPDTHGEVNKIYAYLPEKTSQSPNTVTVGDTTTKLYYKDWQWIKVVDIPAANSATFTYTGQEQTYSIEESECYTVSGNKQIDAGSHTVTVALKDKFNTSWSDGTTDDKTYSFVINKAAPQEEYVPDCELTLTENTDDTFTAAITPVDGAEYSFDNQSWSKSNTKQVNHKEEVTGYIRYAETDNFAAGKAASATIRVGHGTLEHYDAVEETCTENGNIEYYYCPVCKEYFSDAAAQNELTFEETVIAAKNHDFSGDFDAWDENGHWHICNRDGCTATDTPESHIFTSYVSNNDATCTADGTETAKCDCCDATSTKKDTGSATGHDWGAPEWSGLEAGQTASATFTCQNDNSHQTTETATVTSAVKTEATCAETGVTTYTATVSLNGQTYTDTKDVADIPAGHSYENGKCTVCEAIDSDFKAVIIQGANQEWQKGTKDGLSFSSNTAFADFLKVQVDGKDIDASNYTVKEGSAIVTLKASYLETLTVGRHMLAIISETGTATTEFTVKAATVVNDDTKSPQTGYSSNILLWLALLLVSGSCAAAVIMLNQKRK